MKLSGRVEVGVAAGLFLVVTLAFYGPLLGEGFSTHTLLGSFNQLHPDGSRSLSIPERDSLLHTDSRFMVWLTRHGASSALSGFVDFFDAEGCYPAQGTLAYGETGLTLGLLGAPVWLVTRNPIVTFNVVLIAVTWIAAVSMLLLVRHWTGSVFAGGVAASLYAFSEIRASDPVHVNIFDTAWTVLALLFATRLFESRRTRDALGLAACIVLQMGSSFYSLVAAALVGIPFAIGLVLAHGPRALRPAHMALVAGLVLPAAVLLFGPYLSLESTGDLKRQSDQYYAALSFLLPSSPGFFGWVTVALAAYGLVSGWSRAKQADRRADPRGPLLIGTGLILLLSIGALHSVGFVIIGPESGVMTPYMWLARLVPGLDVIRSPVALMPAAHIGVCALGGLGAAALIARFPRPAQPAVGVGLVVLALLETVRPSVVGLTPRIAYATVRSAPSADSLRLFEAARELGPIGPVLMMPARPRDLIRASDDLLLAAYHGERTSACYNFRHFDERLVALSRRVPEPAALDELAELGFRTLALHHPAADLLAANKKRRLDATAAGAGAPLRVVATGEAMTLYALTRAGALDPREASTEPDRG